MTDSIALQQAHEVLITFEGAEPSSDTQRIQEALRCVTTTSDDQILGILADSFTEGIDALNDYTKALGYAVKEPLEFIEGPIYIKFNPQTDLCYCEPYSGEHRGVLVSCQSAVAGGLNHMYGHLPLKLWS
ncbi:MAG: DUF1824 family protein [Thermosynechococcaceae cyanobacterium]